MPINPTGAVTGCVMALDYDSDDASAILKLVWSIPPMSEPPDNILNLEITDNGRNKDSDAMPSLPKNYKIPKKGENFESGLQEKPSISDRIGCNSNIRYCGYPQCRRAQTIHRRNRRKHSTSERANLDRGPDACSHPDVLDAWSTWAKKCNTGPIKWCPVFLCPEAPRTMAP
uniref:Uncharacterized protein n=1 Tax=Romanomermis culicivorax TaxID=13658 RepID=A0A915ISG9_ROMCU